MMARGDHTLALLVFVAAFMWPLTTAFSVVHHLHIRSPSKLALSEEEQYPWIGQADETIADSSLLLESLAARKEQLEKGIGKRYLVRTQKGFLNVHKTPEDGPYATDNIVNQLVEGQVVTSLDRVGDWIQHDAGGWSISSFGGFTWLEPLQE